MDLTAYDVILVDSSAGKDSQAMLDYVVELADQQGVRDRITVVHCDLGRVEWGGTRDLAEEQALHYGVRFEAVKRLQGDLLDHIEQRGMFPGPDTRYCTSDHKRAQVYRTMTALVAEKWVKGTQVRILNCMGIRAQESKTRAKRQAFKLNEQASNGKRHVDEWLPIFDWTEVKVWERISQSGVRYHYAYDLGMPRLSCCFCIFAPKAALLIAGKHNPELLDEYVRVETKIGHTFRVDQSLIQIQSMLAAGAVVPERVTEWAQCA